MLWFTTYYGLQHTMGYNMLWFTTYYGLQHTIVYNILWVTTYNILRFTTYYGLQHTMGYNILLHSSITLSVFNHSIRINLTDLMRLLHKFCPLSTGDISRILIGQSIPRLATRKRRRFRPDQRSTTEVQWWWRLASCSTITLPSPTIWSYRIIDTLFFTNIRTLTYAIIPKKIM